MPGAWRGAAKALFPWSAPHWRRCIRHGREGHRCGSGSHGHHRPMPDLQTFADFDRLLAATRIEIDRLAAQWPDDGALDAVRRQLEALHEWTRGGRCPVQGEKDQLTRADRESGAGGPSRGFGSVFAVELRDLVGRSGKAAVPVLLKIVTPAQAGVRASACAPRARARPNARPRLEPPHEQRYHQPSQRPARPEPSGNGFSGRAGRSPFETFRHGWLRRLGPGLRRGDDS